jgi:hypothetical protein
MAADFMQAALVGERSRDEFQVCEKYVPVGDQR